MDLLYAFSYMLHSFSTKLAYSLTHKVSFLTDEE